MDLLEYDLPDLSHGAVSVGSHLPVEGLEGGLDGADVHLASDKESRAGVQQPPSHF